MASKFDLVSKTASSLAIKGLKLLKLILKFEQKFEQEG